MTRQRSPKQRRAMMAALKYRKGGRIPPRKRRFASGAILKVDDTFVQQHQGLVKSLARRYKAKHFASAADLEDLVQHGNIGLVKAARRYNPRKGAFASIATPHIWNEIKRAAEAGYTVRTPEKTLRKQMRAGQAPILTIGGHTSQELEDKAGGDEGGIAAAHARASIRRLMRRVKLSQDEKQLLKYRYEGDYTLAETAKRLKKSTPRIFKMERAIFAKARAASMQRDQ